MFGSSIVMVFVLFMVWVLFLVMYFRWLVDKVW